MSKTNNMEREFVGNFIPHKLNEAERKTISQKGKTYVMRSDLYEFEKLEKSIRLYYICNDDRSKYACSYSC